MTVDPSAIKPGDRVAVWGVVTLCRDSFADVEFAHGLYTISPSDIATHEPAPPKPLEVGDRVRSDLAGGKIIAIHRGWAVIADDAGQMVPQIAPLNCLERIP